jgi:uncharacterized protein DUF4154
LEILTHISPRSLRAARVLLCALLVMAIGWFAGTSVSIAEEPSLTKYQIEALFLFNFAKYVDWPAGAFTNAAAPIVIGVMGTDPFGDNLQHTIEGKAVNGRPFVIKHLTSDSDVSGCQILFVRDLEPSREDEILDKARALPVLTVAEAQPSTRNGSIINFVLKSGNVRLEINLAAAKKAGLTISSRLLAVADVVKDRLD